MLRDDNAKKFAAQSADWYEAKIREAYRAGWNDAERNMMEKAEALVQVVREQREAEDAPSPEMSHNYDMAELARRAKE